MYKYPMTVKKFDAQVGKVLDLMINSIYTNPDIFLRELISNASDACDKLRHMSLIDNTLPQSPEFKIHLKLDEKTSTVEVSDNGIGMDADDLSEHLGVIAQSGTQGFVEKLENAQSNKDFIGQFGVGFYSCYMVAKNVEVLSKKAGQSKVYSWKSDGKEEYEINELNDFDFPYESGTIIRLQLKADHIEYAKEYKIQHIVKTYSDHISIPVYMQISENEPSLINSSGKPLWCRSKSEITDEEYKEFYQHIAHSPDEPLMTLHHNVEGNIEYKSILFLPSNKPYDLFHPDRQTRVKLYVRKVFITEDNLDIVPKYLRFMRGVIDSEDLPLNISRETLQNNHIIAKISTSLVAKILKTFKSLNQNEPEKYSKIWQNYGEVIKEGLCEGAFEDKQELLEICKFHTSKDPDKLITLDEYLANMQDTQEDIYFLTGHSAANMRQNPVLEGFEKRGIEVLLMEHQVDEFWVNVVNQFKNKTLKSADSAGLDLNQIKPLDEASDSNNEQTSEILTFIKEQLKAEVKDVVESKKLSTSPCVLSIPEGGMNTRMESMLIEQKQLHKRNAKVLEVNCTHPILQKIAKNVESNPDLAKNLVEIIYNQACLIAGQEIGNPFDFINKTNEILGKVG